MPLQILCFAFLVFLSTTASAAVISIKGNTCSIEVMVSGQINQMDIPVFKALTAADFAKDQQKKKRLALCEFNTKPNFTFILLSNGGDVDAALQIGRIIRSIDGSFTIARNCASACVFLLSGGSERLVVNWNGNLGVGIHRFYFSQAAGSDLQEIRYQREALKAKIKAFLLDMDISERVLELSEGIPPENIKWLTTDEASELRLDGTDAAYDERETARKAKELDLGVVEYRSRKSQVREECKNISPLTRSREYEGCRNQILYRMSPAEYETAKNETYNKCERIIGKQPNDATALNSWIEKYKECAERYRVRAR